MEEIQKKYQEQVDKTSDINQHIKTLFEYSKKCNHITEMGVRWVSSTWAFLLSNPKKLISYDIVNNNNILEVIELSKKYDIDYTFIKNDVLKVEIEPTEILFIDTLHTYNQLFSELNLHSEKVKKYIILHDTTSFGRIDEHIYPHSSDVIKSKSVEKQGLMTAIEDFLNTEIGKNWLIHEEFKNNNGLLILKRK